MSRFECAVKDLQNTANSKQEENSKVADVQNSNLTNDETKKEIVNNSIFATITLEKNLRIILLIIICYLITSSGLFIEILGNSFPYLIESGSANLGGKLVISIIIGIAVVLFTSFFEVH